jgi:hypothetical protein
MNNIASCGQQNHVSVPQEGDPSPPSLLLDGWDSQTGLQKLAAKIEQLQDSGGITLEHDIMELTDAPSEVTAGLWLRTGINGHVEAPRLARIYRHSHSNHKSCPVATSLHSCAAGGNCARPCPGRHCAPRPVPP